MSIIHLSVIVKLVIVKNIDVLIGKKGVNGFFWNKITSHL